MLLVWRPLDPEIVGLIVQAALSVAGKAERVVCIGLEGLGVVLQAAYNSHDWHTLVHSAGAGHWEAGYGASELDKVSGGLGGTVDAELGGW